LRNRPEDRIDAIPIKGLRAKKVLKKIVTWLFGGSTPKVISCIFVPCSVFDVYIYFDCVNSLLFFSAVALRHLFNHAFEKATLLKILILIRSIGVPLSSQTIMRRLCACPGQAFPLVRFEIVPIPILMYRYIDDCPDTDTPPLLSLFLWQEGCPS